jgi:histidyl-tRNA synthetase
LESQDFKLAEKVKFQAIKGVRDILPPESALWNRVEQTAREVFGTFGFAEIRLPIFEETELFGRAIGAETDIISKEMFTWEEGGTIIETELPKLWMLKHLGEFRSASSEYVFGNKQRPDLVVREGDDTLVVEFKRRTISQATVADIKEYSRVFSERFPAERSPKLLLVFAEEPSEFVRGLAAANNVGVEVLEVPEYEPRDSLSLRPEATASVVRAYIQHGMQMLPGNAKLYYMGPMFRRERPQKGRYRQFYQIGVEVLGSSDAPGIDAEVIEMLMRFFERLKLKGAVLNINSIGDKNCRPAYIEKLRGELQKVREQLGPDSQRRIDTNPLRVLDSKLENEQGIIEKLPRIAEHLCADCRAHYDEVKRQLGMRGIAYQENWRLVRGLDYYMRTTFEITAPGLGSQNAVCGGGRYDGLVELLGGPATTKGIGFAIGTDRLVLSLQEAGEGETPGGPAGKAGGPDVYLAWFGAAAQAAAIGLARRLRDVGFVVEFPAVEMKFGKSLGLADRLKARHAVIVGDDELAAGTFTVKRLSDGTQQKLGEEELFSYLRASRAI